MSSSMPGRVDELRRGRLEQHAGDHADASSANGAVIRSRNSGSQTTSLFTSTSDVAVELRSSDWVKVKVRAEQDVVVIGWLPRKGSATDLGSLIVAVQSEAGLVHAGQVGSGLGSRTRRELLAALSDLARPNPPVEDAPKVAGARWVEPRIVVRAEFAEWTPDGLLRQPTFLGVVADRGVESTVRDDPPRRAVRATAAAPVSAGVPGLQTAVTDAELAALDALAGGGSLGDRRRGRAAHEPGEGAVPRPATPIPRQ